MNKPVDIYTGIHIMYIPRQLSIKEWSVKENSSGKQTPVTLSNIIEEVFLQGCFKNVCLLAIDFNRWGRLFHIVPSEYRRLALNRLNSGYSSGYPDRCLASRGQYKDWPTRCGCTVTG